MVAPYDAPMDADAVVTPPPVAQPLRLLPFRGLTLAPRRIGAPSSVRAFTRPYHDVAQRLQAWERRGQLTRDDSPAVYLHEYTAGGIPVRGLVGALDLSRPATVAEPAGDQAGYRAGSGAGVAVLPHEGIHPAQVDELADRMLEMQLNPAPILLVHHGTAATRQLMDDVQTRPPTRELTDRSEQRHRIWAIRDPAELARLGHQLASARALIADGHHRYAAYVRMRQRAPGPATDTGLAMLVDQDDTPLFLGAIHRVLAGITLDAFAQAASRAGITTADADAAGAIVALGPHTLVATDGRRWSVLELGPSHVRSAVELLHHEVVARLRRPPSSIGYHHAVDDALRDVARRRGVAVLMPAPAFGEVLRAAAEHRLLPEKATSFQPKPSVGVLIRSLRDG